MKQLLRRRLAVAAALALVAGAGAGGMLAGTATALGAAPGANVTYTGKANEADAITITTNDAATAVSFGWVASGLDGCYGGGTATNLPIRTSPDGFLATSTQLEPSNGATARGWVGYFGDGGAMAGTYGFDFQSAPGRCAGFRDTYTAFAAGTDAQKGPGLTPGGTYTGAVTSVMPGVGVHGTISVTANASGTAISTLSIAYTEGTCDYPVTLTDTTVLDGKVFSTGFRTLSTTKMPSVVGVTQTDRRVSGAFMSPGTGACPAVSGYWTAALTSTPTPTPTAAAAATPTATATATATAAATPTATATATPASATGPIPVGIHFFVFGSGTSSQLVTASGCPIATAVFWASDGAGGFITYVPGTSITLVNDPWNTKFPAGLPANTVLIVRCQ